MKMKVLIAPQSFKGGISAWEAAQAIARDDIAENLAPGAVDQSLQGAIAAIGHRHQHRLSFGFRFNHATGDGLGGLENGFGKRGPNPVSGMIVLVILGR